MNKITAFIPARGGSKGIPGKNFKKFAGKPLVVHSIEYALNCNQIDEVVVSTDDKKIANIAKKYGAEVPFIRPKKISSDSSSMDDVILHTIQELKSIGYEFDILVNVPNKIISKSLSQLYNIPKIGIENNKRYTIKCVK